MLLKKNIKVGKIKLYFLIILLSLFTFSNSKTENNLEGSSTDIKILLTPAFLAPLILYYNPPIFVTFPNKSISPVIKNSTTLCPGLIMGRSKSTQIISLHH